MPKTDSSKDKDHILFIANEQIDIEKDYKKEDKFDKIKLRQKIEPWLTALFQSEHLSLLVGTGLTIALTKNSDLMQGSNLDEFKEFKEKIENAAKKYAENLNRRDPNFEDYLRVATELLRGYEILENNKANYLKNKINKILNKFLENILISEKKLTTEIQPSKETEKQLSEEEKDNKLTLLKSFLLSFASRTSSRDRLNIFTTNYDRIIEFGLDEAGLLTLDRFIGKLIPIMRFHRINLDYHYNPPGIRGEPRYVEGVVRLTKLHGSLDWKFENDYVIKTNLPFAGDMGSFFDNPYENVVIYPNSSKAVETSFFPYSELFRDFSGAICRPNSVLVTYGYGFGDSHINRIIKDMLTIPSTHLVIISYDMASNRIKNFIEQCNQSQLTLMIGMELADFKNLTRYYLPKPAIDRISDRQVKILEKRNKIEESKDGEETHEES